MSDIAPDSRSAARGRLTRAVESVRAAPVATELARTLAAMPVEAAVDELERRLRRALVRHASAHEALEAMAEAALGLEAVGLMEDGARLRLAAALALEGREPGPTMQDLGSVMRMIASAAAEEVDDAVGRAESAGEFVSLLLDVDSDGFTTAVAHYAGRDIVTLGRTVREELLREGRVVAVARCRHCRGCVVLDAELRCPACGRTPRHPDFVVPREVPEALRAAR